ncbi:hypothetical protein ACET3Z_025595 [Daucus carota]
MAVLRNIVYVLLIAVVLAPSTTISTANKIADVQPNDDLCYQPCGAVLFPCEAVTDGPPRSTCNFTCTQCGFNRGECVQDDKCCCRSE